MKNIIIVISVFVVGLLFAQAACNTTSSGALEENNTGIKFFKGSFDEALALAKKENKIVFMDAYATWCGPCKGMSRDVFTNESLGEYFNQNFINIKIDMEKGSGPSLSRKYNVRAFPTLLFLDGEGKILDKKVGYHSKAQLLKVAKKLEK